MTMAIDRTFGMYQMSMPTSLALEGLCHTGEGAERRGEAPVKSLESLWVNLRTLIRNAVRSFPSKEIPFISTSVIVESVLADWEALQDVIETNAPSAEVQLYACTYKTAKEKIVNADGTLLIPSAAKQVEVYGIENSAFVMLSLELKNTIKEFDSKLIGDGAVHSKRSMLITHCPVDLLSKYQFISVQLLESHTGIVKLPRDFNSKLNTHKENYPLLPFNKTTLLFFGDGVMIKPQALQHRRAVIEIAKRRHWNPLTTEEKVYTDIKLENDPTLTKLARSFKYANIIS